MSHKRVIDVDQLRDLVEVQKLQHWKVSEITGIPFTFETHAKDLKQLVEKLGSKVKSVKPVRSGYFAPKINRYCYDIQLA